MSDDPLFTAPDTLVRELLMWVARQPRTYRETMDAWRTSCPRLPVWEDALESGLLAVVGGRASELEVEVTPEGRAFVERETR